MTGASLQTKKKKKGVRSAEGGEVLVQGPQVDAGMPPHQVLMVVVEHRKVSLIWLSKITLSLQKIVARSGESLQIEFSYWFV